MKPWVNKVKKEIISKTDNTLLRIYFNNHYGAKAVINAFEFKKMLGISLSKRETNALIFAKSYYSRPPSPFYFRSYLEICFSNCWIHLEKSEI